jgi:hypothetical protein
MGKSVASKCDVVFANIECHIRIFLGHLISFVEKWVNQISCVFEAYHRPTGDVTENIINNNT